MINENLFFNKNLLIIYSITFTGIMGVASITPAFPQIANHFNLELDETGLLISIFTIPGIVFTPILGIMADRFGRKTILIPALLLFAQGGLLCVYANSFNQLLIYRFIQGIGAAAIGTISLTLIGDVFADVETVKAMGYNAVIIAIGTTLYPAIGAALASIDWYYPFYLPLLGIASVILVLIYLDNPNIDREDNLSNCFLEVKTALKDKRTVQLFFSTMITFILLDGAFLTYFPFLIHQKFEISANSIGLFMAYMAMITALVSYNLKNLLESNSESRLIKISYILYALALLIFLTINEVSLIYAPLTIFGVAHGINMPIIISTLSTISTLNNRGVILSLNGTVIRIGQTLGPLIFGWFFIIGKLSFVFLGGTIISLATYLILVIFYKDKLYPNN